MPSGRLTSYVIQILGPSRGAPVPGAIQIHNSSHFTTHFSYLLSANIAQIIVDYLASLRR
jgi:hypothetical protein